MKPLVLETEAPGLRVYPLLRDGVEVAVAHDLRTARMLVRGRRLAALLFLLLAACGPDFDPPPVPARQLQSHTIECPGDPQKFPDAGVPVQPETNQ